MGEQYDELNKNSMAITIIITLNRMGLLLKLKEE